MSMPRGVACQLPDKAPPTPSRKTVGKIASHLSPAHQQIPDDHGFCHLLEGLSPASSLRTRVPAITSFTHSNTSFHPIDLTALLRR